MQEELLREIAARQPWQTESIRLTAFPSPTMNLENTHWWRDVTGQPPETRVSQPRLAGYQEAGLFQGGRLLLNVQPPRIDWNLTPAGAGPAQEFPTIGPLAAALPQFVVSMGRWLAAVPAVQRLALGLVLHLPVTDLQDGYRRLTGFLPDLRIDVEGSSDLFYQINRARPSRSGIPGLRINRLSKWSVAIMQQVMLSVSAGRVGQMMETQPITTCRLEVDINTAPSFEGDLPRERLVDITDELADLSIEIALRGDVP